MSGICAVWRKNDAGRIDGMLTAIQDGLSLAAEERRGQEIEAGIGVGVVARFPDQQVYCNNRVLVACDADLLNEKDLIGEAGTSADAPRARTAALLAALYARSGAGFINKLRGAFSLVLWDRVERRLLAAIDGFGIKRLAYHCNGNVLAIASRVDALARTGEVDLAINPRAIANVLNFSTNLAPETIFSKVERLIPGAMLVATERETRIEKYWDMRYGVVNERDEARLSRELELVIQASVAAHCKDDPLPELGAFLSGGTDSSTVVGMMTRRAGRPVKCFSIGFEDQSFNELGYAELAARQFHSAHNTYMVGPRDCFEALPQMIRSVDEPFGNSSAIPTYFCARLAAQHGVKTLLAGDGGDELFGGNERYATDKIFEVYHDVHHVLRKGLIEPALRILPGVGPFRRASGYVRRANMPGVERMLSFQFLRTHPLEEIFENDFLEALAGYTILDIPARHYAQAQARDHLDRLLYVDMKITLADNDLPKVTCMSELAGIQTRFPFLDRSVAEFSGRIPARLKVKWLDKRYLFKRAFRELLPIEILRKKKHGFGIPVASWLNTDKRMRELSRDTLLSARAFGRGYFRRGFIEDLFRKAEADSSCFYGDTIWTFLMIELWHRQAVDQRTGVPA